jgi:hypothetical protein
MTLAFLLIWITGLLGESLPPIRAVRAGFIGRYKWFYSYLIVVLLRDASLFAIYFIWPKVYRPVYWSTEFVGALLGCGLVWEVYKIALARYPGTARMARNLLALAFVFTFARVLSKGSSTLHWVPGRTTLELELDLRVIEIAMLFALVAVFAYYAIPLGRNLNGIVYGYGLFLASSLVNLTLRERLGDSFQNLWQYIQPGCYMLVLLVWIWGLWSYRPVPEPEVEPVLELRYEALVRATRGKLFAARDRLAKGMRL